MTSDGRPAVARPEPIPLDLARERILRVVGVTTFPGISRDPDGKLRPEVMVACYVYDHSTGEHGWVRLLMDSVQFPIWQTSAQWGMHNARTQQPEEEALDRLDASPPPTGPGA